MFLILPIFLDQLNYSNQNCRFTETHPIGSRSSPSAGSFPLQISQPTKPNYPYSRGGSLDSPGDYKDLVGISFIGFLLEMRELLGEDVLGFL